MRGDPEPNGAGSGRHATLGAVIAPTALMGPMVPRSTDFLPGM